MDMSGRPNVVDSLHKALEWEIHSALLPKTDSSRVRWGAICNQMSTQGQRRSDETETYQCIGAGGWIFCTESLHEKLVRHDCAHQSPKSCYSSTSQQNGRLAVTECADIYTEDIALVFIAKDHITVECLPEVQNTEADYQYRVFCDGSY